MPVLVGVLALLMVAALLEQLVGAKLLKFLLILVAICGVIIALTIFPAVSQYG